VSKTVVSIDGLDFVCENRIEIWRAETLLEKEPGTIAWLKGLKDGDIFYDIGANIGCYTLYAARLVGEKGHVYAFEPHLINARSLMRNVLYNKMQDRVSILTCALSDREGLIPFNYHSSMPGSSGSQLGHTKLEAGGEFVPWTTELKWALPLDRLGMIRPSNFIKIDVDGNELAILRGGPFALYESRSVQVEIHPESWDEIQQFMVNHKYVLDHTHYTQNGQEAIAQGKDPATLPYNAVFTRI
jgi:FkbM family methyltransferase